MLVKLLIGPLFIGLGIIDPQIDFDSVFYLTNLEAYNLVSCLVEFCAIVSSEKKCNHTKLIKEFVYAKMENDTKKFRLCIFKSYGSSNQVCESREILLLCDQKQQLFETVFNLKNLFLTARNKNTQDIKDD